MLANDPHLPPIFPTLWYENHLVGGRYDVTGFTSPGVPGVIIGHNQNIAWGITNGYADVQDLFVERFNDHDPMLYAWEEGWRRADVREEVIHVRGRRKAIIEHVRVTHHGPVISDLLDKSDAAGAEAAPRHALALRWASHDENNHLRALLGICRAADWDDFRQAACDWAFPPQNVVYADTAGNIGYLLPGRIPRRARGDGLTPVPGWRGDYEWQGWIPPEELPALFNPEAGYIVTANNQVTGDSYPYLLSGEWLAPYRAQRIASLIEKLAPLDVPQHAQIQTDTLSLPAQRFVTLALAAIESAAIAEHLSQDARDALALLKSWRGDMAAHAVEPALAFSWQICFTRDAMYQALGPKLGRELLDANGHEEIPTHPFHEIAYEIALRWLQNGAPPWVGDVQALLPEALEKGLHKLRAHLGARPAAWHWGRLHYVELHSYLSRIPGVGRLWKPATHPIGGDSFTVSQARIAPRLPPGAVHVIASCRMILDVGAWDNSVSTLPGGQSGHPASEHYQDSVEDWLRGTYHPMLYSRRRIEAAAHNRLFLRPSTVEDSDT